MLKIAALLFNSIALLFYQLFFVDTVTVTPSAPATAQVGTEFTVELTVSKGSNTGFAKLQQDLPAGFTAVEGESNGGSFTFVNQSVKIIWMALPNNESFKISYKVKTSAEALGTKTITGKLAFVIDNIKQTIEIPATSINITSDNATQPVAAVDNSQTTPAPATEKTPVISEAANVNCSRNLPTQALATKGFSVDVTIKKGNLSGFAKFVETLPAGLTATAGDTKGAVFSFEDQKATFIWSVMPTEPEFKISYSVKMDPTVNGEQLIEGVFSFNENNETLKYVLSPNFVKVTPATPVATSTETPKELSATNIPQGEGKVNYKVQILALRKAKEATAIKAHFKMSETVATEMAEGYTKYTAGHHEKYDAARGAREVLRTRNGVAGPFVTAYNNGKRITVQEALMITNQKWYK